MLTTPLGRRSSRLRQNAAATGVAAALVFLNACGGDSAEADAVASDVASLDEVASLDTDSVDDASTDAGSTLDADEAALAFSECLREQGLDVPDIGVDADGNIDLRDSFQDLGDGGEDVRTAMDSCSDILGDVGFGGGRDAGGGIDNTAIQDAMIELTECVREQGFPEATELTFGQPAAGEAPAEGEAPDGERPEQRGEGEGGGAGAGDITTRFATQMGLDGEDPDVIAAMETCSPIIEEAFTDAGVGAGRAEG